MSPKPIAVAAVLLFAACDTTSRQPQPRSEPTVPESTVSQPPATTPPESTTAQSPAPATKPPAPAVSLTGRVRWFNNSKGYGFIIPDDGSADVFVHHSAIEMEGFRTLKEGQLVRFVVRDGPRGREAADVRLP